MAEPTSLRSGKPIPTTVWSLGFVSLFMDLSSELIHSVLPLFLVGTLGAGALAVGLIEGVAEATSQIVKVFSGAVSDYFGRRKAMLLAGYGLAAATKPLFPLAGTADLVMLARVLDRVGKGIRGAPRDALIADVTPPEMRGASYGLRQAMDTIGALLGPALAVVLLVGMHLELRTTMWFAVIPAVLCVLVIVALVREPTHIQPERRVRSPIHPAELRRFTPAYWWVVGVGLVLSLARFSEAFLILRGQQCGLALGWTPIVMVVMSATYAASAYPAGRWSDHVPRATMLAISLLPLLGAEAALAAGAHIGVLMVGVALWGIHLGFSQGVVSALVADVTPRELRGTAFGVFNLTSGLALLAANAVAGWIWQRHGAAATFTVGAIVAAIAFVGVVAGRHTITPRASQ